MITKLKKKNGKQPNVTAYVVGNIFFQVKAHHIKTSKHRKYIQIETLKKCLLGHLNYEEVQQIYNK